MQDQNRAFALNHSRTIAVLMDPIEQIHFYKDSTLGLLYAAQERGHRLLYVQTDGLLAEGASVRVRAAELKVALDERSWYELGPEQIYGADSFDILLMRRDPPFNMEYVYTTYLLEALERQGVLVVNRPQPLRDLNEKVALMYFQEHAPDFVIGSDRERLEAAIHSYGQSIIKPLDGMGGRSIYSVRSGDTNVPVILEDMTDFGQTPIMVQRYVPEIVEGDKRVFVVAGQVADMMLVRRPVAGEHRGNMAAGGQAMPEPITDVERKIAESVGPYLHQRGIVFAGIDVIGNYLTEVNVTSPTGIRELAQVGCDLAGTILDAVIAEYDAR
ncbi:MAG: glutathione synthase [Gammaproteobacteria bacterium]